MSDNNRGLIRIQKIRTLMKENGLDALVVYSRGDHRPPEPLFYLSGFKPMGTGNALILSFDDATLLVSPEWEAPRAKRESWLKDIRPTTNLPEDCLHELDRIKCEHIGIVGHETMNQDVMNIFRSKLESIIPADQLVDRVGRIRDSKDLDLARRAAAMADAGFEAMLDLVRPGIREYEISAELEYVLKRQNADDNFVLLSSGHHNHLLHVPSDRRVEDGDVVLFEISPGYRCQFIQLCRTMVVGKTTKLQLEKFSILAKALEKSLAVVRPGTRAGEIAMIQNEVITSAGYGEYCKPPYMRTRGHGYGVGSNAPGWNLEEKLQKPLEEGMILVVHPNQYFPETGYLALGDPIIVTRDGAERLTHLETRIYSTLR